jgi:ferredoxin
MIIKPSTRSWFRERRNTFNGSFFDFLHGYVYGRWPYLYIGVAIGEHRLGKIGKPLFALISLPFKAFGYLFNRNRSDRGSNGKTSRQKFADTYHGKVVPLSSARKLVTVNRDISLRNLEHVIPYETARDIVLKNPDHLAVLQCPCRKARKNPCTPLDVCLVVGEPFASFILEHHPERARKITSDEAAEILREEDNRGHVHHAFFKDAMLGRFYAICNCCKCCCGAMQAHRSGTPMLASSGYVAKVDHTRCVACGTCARYCQFEAVTFFNGVKNIDAVKCLGCGVCIPKCTKNALTLERDPSRGVPLELDELMTEAEKF